MRIDIISVLPELLESPFSHSIMKRGIEKKLVDVRFHNLHDYSNDNHKSVDDYAYGGGAGMVMLIEPIAKCIDELKSKNDYDEVIYMSPDGELLNQKMSNNFSTVKNFI